MRPLVPAAVSLAALAFATAACAQAPGGGAKGEQTRPREEATASGAPVEQGQPNVPANTPAFPQQNRAPAVKTSVPLAVTPVATGLDRPWALAFLPDGRALVTEKGGALKLVDLRTGYVSAPFQGLPKVNDEDQSGLLDVLPARDFAQSRIVYLSFSEPRGEVNGLAILRAKLVEGQPGRLDDPQVIFRVEPGLKSGKHNGGRLAWGPDGKLYVTSGERSILPGRMQAQHLDAAIGKVLRLNADGSIPKDNPFVGRAGARPEIWSMGHRNPLSLAFDGQGRLWEVEMGPRGGDEVNVIRKGADYGWPTIGYGEEYSGEPIHATTQKAGMEQPVYYWDPVISPAGLTVYSGTLFPEWRGDLFIGGLSSKALVRLHMRDGKAIGEERLLTDKGKRIREVKQGPDGALYVLTDGKGGELWRVAPAG